jgi:spore coat polysaccharide biosynthesis protein SpsF
MRKLVASIACRNTSARLFAKPLHNLDINNNITILDYLIHLLKSIPEINEIVLGISEGVENEVFKEYANKHGINFITGDEKDVLHRLILCCEKVEGTDVFRVTSESPFTYFEGIQSAWASHLENNNDATFLDNVPDGSNFEIITLEALKKSHNDGEDKHRSELCTSYIRENKDQFKIELREIPEFLKRLDLRLTVDYPEDLILCRAVYENFKEKAPLIPVREIIEFLDSKPELVKLTAQLCEEGYSTMYK